VLRTEQDTAKPEAKRTILPMCVMAVVWPCGLTIHKDNLLLGLSQGTSDVLILGTSKLCY
jgi:hypothetical protein